MTKFKLDYYTGTVKRLVYTVDSSGNSKSSYISTWNSAKWYLSPASSNNSDVGLDRYWQIRNFECNAPFDIRESDILTIDNVDYEVKSFAHVKGIRIDRIRVVLVLPKNE